jgi:hypothetical protein
MSKRFFSGIALAFVAALLVVLPAAASVTFDPLTGTGFVGKGDVQSAFGWNNQQLQANAAGVSFTYIVEGTLSQTCEREAGASEAITREFTRIICASRSALFWSEQFLRPQWTEHGLLPDRLRRWLGRCGVADRYLPEQQSQPGPERVASGK